MSKPHTIEELQAMVDWHRARKKNPTVWLVRLNEAKLRQIKTEVKAKHKHEREAKRAQEASS